MASSIDYYFTSISPFSYLGHKTLMEISSRTGAAVNFMPFDLFGVWENSGAVPPAKRPPLRQRYRLVELQRVAAMRNTCLNPKPAHFPTDPSLADHCICALAKSGSDPATFVFEAGRAVWERDLQIADEAVIKELLKECGHDAELVLEQAASPEIAAVRQSNTEAAKASDAVGAPAYVYEEEVFWGQDRLEYLEQMIVSGRKAFQSDL
ncbi:MAG: 2-hydroxychromene-2-carboxylate isomerase [Pseudomonadota bacterium]